MVLSMLLYMWTTRRRVGFTRKTSEKFSLLFSDNWVMFQSPAKPGGFRPGRSRQSRAIARHRDMATWVPANVAWVEEDWERDSRCRRTLASSVGAQRSAKGDSSGVSPLVFTLPRPLLHSQSSVCTCHHMSLAKYTSAEGIKIRHIYHHKCPGLPVFILSRHSSASKPTATLIRSSRD